ncbi:MAG: hypothetical protein HY361_04950 [Candidatus Aenigmarchaeota archaeon]|nr:hypothetical protein [Candidatus Aenigmarchaeota archaeon]
MQYSHRTVQVVETYVAKFPFDTIHLDGAGSPEVGRRILEDGREKLQEKRGEHYVTITSTKPGRRANFLLTTPSKTFVDILDAKIYQMELSEAVVQALTEYLGDKTPVTNTQDIEWKPRKEEEPVWYQEYSARSRAIGRGIKTHPLQDLPAYLDQGTFEPFPLSAGMPNEAYQSPNGVASVLADRSGVYVVQNPLTAEQLTELLSKRAGWNLHSRNGHKK